MINKSRLYLISIWQSTSTHEEHYTIDLSSKASLFQNEKTIQYKSNSTSIPVLTSLEEEAVPGYIQFACHLAQGGCNYSWNQVKSTDGESINARSVSSWARSESHWVQLSIGGLIWLTPQPVDWRIHQKSSSWAKNVLRREGGRNSS